MLTTPFVTGSPNWTDLTTPDVEGASAFYTSLFGWDHRTAGPGTGGYGIFELDGRSVAGVMPAPSDEAPPAWSLYFQTPDAAATASAVKAAGGSVLQEPTEITDLGVTAVFADVAGAGFAVWQPGRNKGLERVNDPGCFTWGELYTPDEDAAFSFYSAVLGWEAISMPIPGGNGTYRMVNPAGQGSDTMFGGFVPLESDPTERESPAHWLLYFSVTDCDDTVTRARDLGGEVRMAPVEVDGVGRFAKLADPYGARFAVMQSVVAAA